MKIGIGIMAYNEAARIRATLASLREQDLLARGAGGDDIDIRVVANGCRDDTAAVAGRACDELFAGLPGVHAGVAVLEQAGKSNAWNEYVHRLAAPDADRLILMDGDITLVGAGTLRQLVDALSAAPEAHASVDTILKDIALKADLSARERMSLAASELTRAGPPKLAGSLYCARGPVLRGIWMPVGLLVEDGYLKALLCTDNFTRPDNPARLVRAPDAAHVFEAVTDARILFRHEVRILVGSAVNFILFDHLRARVTSGEGDAGAIVGRLNAQQPDWFPRLVDESLRRRGWWLAPTGFILLPLQQLRHLPAAARLRRLPAALLRAAFNLAAAVAANTQLRRRTFRW